MVRCTHRNGGRGNKLFGRCGTDTIRSEDLSHGRVGIGMGFAPLKPAEFVRVRSHCLAEAR